MRLRTLSFMILCAVTALGAVKPAYADDDWHRHERHEREEWRERDWRQHEWRQHEWHEREYAPPIVSTPPYGYYAPPPVYYANPGYYR